MTSPSKRRKSALYFFNRIRTGRRARRSFLRERPVELVDVDVIYGHARFLCADGGERLYTRSMLGDAKFCQAVGLTDALVAEWLRRSDG